MVIKPSEVLSRNDREPEEVEIERSQALRRMPGLYRRWELEDLLGPDVEMYVEPAGGTIDGTDLYAVYRRDEHLGSPREV